MRNPLSGGETERGVRGIIISAATVHLEIKNGREGERIAFPAGFICLVVVARFVGLFKTADESAYYKNIRSQMTERPIQMRISSLFVREKNVVPDFSFPLADQIDMDVFQLGVFVEPV